ncbi:MAG: hypothetical protein ACOY93_06330 [Bacillota bacterium]
MRVRPKGAWSRVIIGMLGIGVIFRLMLQVSTATPAARVIPDPAGLTFQVDHPPRGVEPRLRLWADADLTDHLQPAEGAHSWWLPNQVLAKFPAVRLTYTWELGRERLRGEHLHIHRDYPYPWQVVQKGGLTVYFASPVAAGRISRWAELNDWLPRFLGTPQQPVVIYAMPDEEAYARVIGGNSHLDRAAGFFSGAHEWIVLRPAHGEEAVAHELGHAYLANGNPVWWEEGIATWVEAHARARTSPVSTWLHWRSRLAPLGERAAEGPLELAQAGYGSAQPLDPYDVGLSFCLYLERRLGTEGLKRLALAARREPLADALSRTVGEEVEGLEADWNRALQSGELLAWLAERAGP